ncbi:MAG: DUF4054 domain-containing protein [Candidatus Margulisbacteria bacterium]|nr:DUF4054 domain-containing protein [Candidatus Margulisiibacteriota bacterium]
MGISRLNVISRHPEFSDIPNGVYFNSVIASAIRQVSPKHWGNLVHDGIILLTGHYLALGRRKGLTGSITMEKVGDLQRSYEGSGNSTNSLSATSYGAEYLRLVKTIPSRPLVC